MDKKLILVLLDQLLDADDIAENRKEALKAIKDEILKSGTTKISKEKMVDYGLRISNIVVTVWKLLE